jgi:membrane protease YdiL (CAAX protease family)
MSGTPGSWHGEPARLATGFVGGFLLLALLPSLVWPACRELFGTASAGDAAAMFARKVEASALASLAGMFAIVALAVAVRPGLPLRPRGRDVLPRAALAYAAWLPAWALLVALYVLVLHAVGGAIEAQDPLRYLVHEPAAAPAYWLVVATVVLGAPLAEELLFRGFLQPSLEPRLGRSLGLAASALLFGLGHGLAYALPIGLLGAFFGWLVQRHASLLPAIVAHALHNAVTVAAMVAWPPMFDWMYPR